MKIIGAGIGRTGTTSLKAALERLLSGPCYHMETIVKSQDRTNFWYDWSQRPRSIPALERELEGFAAGVDAPLCFFYEELMATYPDAKVILSTREPRSWVASFNRLMGAVHHLRLLRFGSRRLGHFLDFTAVMGDRFMPEDRSDDALIRWFNAHNERVQREVPADRLLVYPVGAGWEPLCEFLGVDVPDVPYPHSNAGTGDIRKMVMKLTGGGGG